MFSITIICVNYRTSLFKKSIIVLISLAIFVVTHPPGLVVSCEFLPIITCFPNTSVCLTGNIFYRSNTLFLVGSGDCLLCL